MIDRHVTTLYVPNPDFAAAHPLAHVERGSALAGKPEADGGLRVYYEGGIYQTGPRCYANLAAVAAGRLTQRAETSAVAIVDPEAVLAIGEYDSAESVVRLTGPREEALLADWLGLREVGYEQLIGRL